METVLSAAVMMRSWRNYAYAAALSASNLECMEIPDWVCELIILADADEAGEKAATALAARALRERGMVARIARPPGGHNDFNDALRAL